MSFTALNSTLLTVNSSKFTDGNEVGAADTVGVAVGDGVGIDEGSDVTVGTDEGAVMKAQM